MTNQNSGSSKFEYQDLPPEIAKLVYTMKPGEVSEPFSMFSQKLGREVFAIVKLKNYIPTHKANLTDDFQTLKTMCESQLSTLKYNTAVMISQIQPHFLYNALNTIKYLIKKDPKTAEQVVVKFSKYLRANMDSLTQKTPLPVEKELDHVANYTDIEQHRFGNRLNVVYDIGCKNFVILPLTIQPIVENAIKHGINQKPEGGTVTIKTYDDEEFFYVDISDDGVGFDVNKKPDENDERSHVGVSNIKTRLREMLKATVEVESTVGVGTKVLVKIPKNDETRLPEC